MEKKVESITLPEDAESAETVECAENIKSAESAGGAEDAEIYKQRLCLIF